MTLLVYFDTNVYRMISERGESVEVERLIRSASHEVSLVASGENLRETYAIRDERTCRRELEVLTRLATRFFDLPISYRQALEVRYALSKHRPSWMSPIQFSRQMRDFLSEHRKSWQDARKGLLPHGRAFETYRKDEDKGIKQSRAFQRAVREQQLNGARVALIGLLGSRIIAAQVHLDDPEQFWRIESLNAFYKALIQRHPSCRDLADWLLPYLKPAAIGRDAILDWYRFWMSDVEASEVQHNRVGGLVCYQQLSSKITHGNSLDQLHSGYGLHVNVFVTADEAFFEALSFVRTLVPSFAAPYLLNRAATTALPSLAPIFS